LSGVLGERSAGILLHPTSLPGEGIGSLGAEARRFVDWLAGAGQSYWQILPLVATDEGGSPYNGLSAMAGNPLLIDLEALAREGLLDGDDLAGAPGSEERIDYPAVVRWKEERLRRAHRAWREGSAPGLAEPFARFREEQEAWLGDFALFRALRAHHDGAAWTRWEPGLRDRDPDAMRAWRERLAEEVERTELEQFLFDRQWGALREYAGERGIRLIGDIPIFVSHNSADVWANQALFQLDEGGEPEVVSGVPPDYFSATGQRWGNPLYRWERMRERGFDWWVRRFRRMLEWVDLVRIDHFRGFEAYWEIPAPEETALNGRWVNGPGQPLFREVERRLGELPVIAEDLGLITTEVEALRDALDYPGMRVLQFAFDGDARNPHLPENHPANSVAYTGTHDNDTALGWWRGASTEERERASDALPEDLEEVHWALIEAVFRSPARLAVVPLQDVLGLGSDARMNTPGTAASNWTWRFRAGALTEEARERLRELTRRTGRLPDGTRRHASHEPSECT
jgi:4-alpha-glucanotransferase